MTFREMYVEGRGRLTSAGIESAGLDARVLMAYSLREETGRLVEIWENEASSGEVERYFAIVDRRARREPLEYIVGRCEFMSLPFFVDRSVLIPRPDTETLVEAVLEQVKRGKVLEIGAGSGCIGISLAYYAPEVEVKAIDISAEAVRIARRNAEDNGVASRVQFRVGDVFDEIMGCYDVVVSNPPYVVSGEIAGLQPEVRDHEPRGALDGGEDGLRFYKRIVKVAQRAVLRGGLLAVEVGLGQAGEVSRLMRDVGFDVDIVRDLQGIERVLIGIKIEN